MNKYFYSPEETKWLIDNTEKYANSIELTKDFNSMFTRNRDPLAVRSKCQRLGFRFGWSGGKQKGEGSSVTALPIGSERWTGGYLYVKINDVPLPKNFTNEDVRKNWIQKHRLVWEQVNGEIANNEVVVFLDCNRNNFEISNLYCTNRKVTLMMRRNNWFSENPEITLAAIKCCELHFALKPPKGE